MMLLILLFSLSLLTQTKAIPKKLIYHGEYCQYHEIFNNTVVKVMYDYPDLVNDEGVITEFLHLPTLRIGIDESDQEHMRFYTEYHKHVKGRSGQDQKEWKKMNGEERKQAKAEEKKRENELKKQYATSQPQVKRMELSQRTGSLSFKAHKDSLFFACLSFGRVEALHDIKPQLGGLAVVYSHDEMHHEHEQLIHQMNTMEVRVERIRNHIELQHELHENLKEVDKEFHAKYMEVYKSSLKWPIIQILVLIITSFIQASYLVGFFKKKKLV